jgi:hypothetical protein
VLSADVLRVVDARLRRVVLGTVLLGLATVGRHLDERRGRLGALRAASGWRGAAGLCGVVDVVRARALIELLLTESPPRLGRLILEGGH